MIPLAIEESYYTLNIDYMKILTLALQSLWFILKKCWLPLLVVIILGTILNVLRADTIRKNRQMRARQEEEIWERRMERFLEKKDRHDRQKK